MDWLFRKKGEAPSATPSATPPTEAATEAATGAAAGAAAATGAATALSAALSAATSVAPSKTGNDYMKFEDLNFDVPDTFGDAKTFQWSDMIEHLKKDVGENSIDILRAISEQTVVFNKITENIARLKVNHRGLLQSQSDKTRDLENAQEEKIDLEANIKDLIGQLEESKGANKRALGEVAAAKAAATQAEATQAEAAKKAADDAANSDDANKPQAIAAAAAAKKAADDAATAAKKAADDAARTLEMQSKVSEELEAKKSELTVLTARKDELDNEIAGLKRDLIDIAKEITTSRKSLANFLTALQEFDEMVVGTPGSEQTQTGNDSKVRKRLALHNQDKLRPNPTPKTEASRVSLSLDRGSGSGNQPITRPMVSRVTGPAPRNQSRNVASASEFKNQAAASASELEKQAAASDEKAWTEAAASAAAQLKAQGATKSSEEQKGGYSYNKSPKRIVSSKRSKKSITKRRKTITKRRTPTTRKASIRKASIRKASTRKASTRKASTRKASTRKASTRKS